MWKGIIKIVTENTVYNKKMIAEEGLSILIEEYNPHPTKILIDTGRRVSTLLENLNSLSEDPKSIDFIIATHGHNGHIQALSDFLVHTKKPKLILNPTIFDQKYKKKNNEYLIGGTMLSRLHLLNYSTLFETEKPFPITEHIWTSGYIRATDLNQSDEINERYWKKPQNTPLTPDKFEEEIAVFIKSNLGTIIITSCGHRGIENTISVANAIFKGEPIACVIGGFHTRDKPETLPTIINSLVNNQAQLIMPCHCTGFQGKSVLKSHWKENLIDIATGSIIKIGNKIEVMSP